MPAPIMMMGSVVEFMIGIAIAAAVEAQLGLTYKRPGVAYFQS
jgi:hypothetical protein